ncbi:efflux RND transporter periplasmic adaptor subunit [Flavilitoribacter nigricans]|nr:efflux RND transporter periplasmic adaptor subunit [Flavilitoribacter nigricans]
MMLKENSSKICRFLLSMLPLLFFYACKKSSSTDEAVNPIQSITATTEQPTPVSGMILTKGIFKKEIISQGIVKAVAQSEVVFPVDGIIEKILIQTGQRVKRGSLLAQLDSFKFQNERDLLQQQILKARIQLEAKMLSLGYKLEDSLTIDQKLWRNIQIESNLPNLKLQLQMAEHQLSRMSIRAPLSGVVADLEAQAGNPTTNFGKLCTIIDDHKLEVQFPILETELASAKIGSSITAFPLSDPERKINGVVKSINPKVDANGMIRVRAELNGSFRGLLNGMKIRIQLAQNLPNFFIIPKTAVVDRQGKLAAFLYKNGKAHWNYVQIAHENTTEYAIGESELNTGDTIIISNTFDLANLESVSLDSISTGLLPELPLAVE